MRSPISLKLVVADSRVKLAEARDTQVVSTVGAHRTKTASLAPALKALGMAAIETIDVPPERDGFRTVKQWAEDVGSIVRSCVSSEALDAVQQRNRELLKSLSREQPGLSDELGSTFSSRRLELGKSHPTRAGGKPRKERGRTKRTQPSPVLTEGSGVLA